MISVTLWLLIATAGGSHSSATNLGQFKEEAQCLAAATDLERKSAARSGMRTVYGVCVQATIYR